MKYLSHQNLSRAKKSSRYLISFVKELVAGSEEVEGKEDTAFFLQLVIKFWTIMNVKSEGADIKHMNPSKKFSGIQMTRGLTFFKSLEQWQRIWLVNKASG